MKRIPKAMMGLWLVAATLLLTGIAIAAPTGTDSSSTSATEVDEARPVRHPPERR